MTRATDAQLQDALNMLAEARDYLARLPAVPVTRQFIWRLTQFLESPSNQLLPWAGRYHAPSGRAILDVLLLDTSLELRLAEQEKNLPLSADELMRALRPGVRVVLDPPPVVPGRNEA